MLTALVIKQDCTAKKDLHVLQLRSEGFSFILGALGWRCVGSTVLCVGSCPQLSAAVDVDDMAVHKTKSGHSWRF